MNKMLVKNSDHFWPLVWAVTSIVLGGVLVLESEFGRSGAGTGPRGPARVAEAKLLPAFRLAPESQAGAQTLERPLFVPGRRPAPAAASAGSGAIRKGQLILQGTTLVGSLSIAMLKEVSTGVVHRVEKGGEILGMTLAEIAAEQVVLKAGGDTETLALVVAKGSGNAVAAVERGPFGSSVSPAPPGTQAGRPAAAPGAPSPIAGGDSTGPVPTARAIPSGAMSVSPPIATPGSAAMTPEEIIARRRAARRPQPQN